MRTPRKLTPKIVVELSGGSIRAVYASVPDIAYTVIDWDELRLNEPLPVIVSRPLASASEEIRELVASCPQRSS